MTDQNKHIEKLKKLLALKRIRQPARGRSGTAPSP